MIHVCKALEVQSLNMIVILKLTENICHNLYGCDFENEKKNYQLFVHYVHCTATLNRLNTWATA